MGTSVVGQLDPQKTAALPGVRDAMTGAGTQGSTTAFNFFAAFDGTNNDRNNLALSGDSYKTNIGEMAAQAENARIPNGYYPGVGTGEDRGGTINAGVAPNAPIQATAENAYRDFVKAASDYKDSGGAIEDISASVAGFSRGGATAIKFAQLVNERGLVDADGNVLAPPGSVPITGMALLDPVGRFVDGDLSIPPNVQGQVLVVQAADENRSDFRPLDFSKDQRVTTVEQSGNHVGIGGGYDQGGTAANVLEGVTGYFQNRGVAVADVPAEQRFNPEVEPTLYTEAYRTDSQGNVLTNENGTKLLAWSVDDPTQGRQLDSVEHPGSLSEDQQAANAASLLSNFASLGHWSELSDSQRIAVLGALYNTADHMNGGELPGDLGSATSALGLINALEHGNTGSAVVSGVSLANNLGENFASKEIGAAIGMDAGNVVPGLNLALALESGNTTSIVAATASFIPVYGPLISVGISLFGGDLFGDDDPPPPPEGAAHFSWDESGYIQHTVDYNQSGGGDAANQVAASVQSMLQNLVDAHNAQNASTADDIAINPYLLPKMGFSGSSAWMEVVLPDGTTVREGVSHEGFAQRLLEVLQDNGGLAPAWQVQTQQMHYQQALQEGQTQEQAEAPLRLGAGGQAVAGDEVFSLQGNAAESADFKSQTFGALVVHLNDNPNVQAAQTQLTTVLRDVEGDGYFEQTQAVAAKDSAGNLQAVLTLDFNGDGVIQTRDILNLGGNTSQGNPTDEARLANANADQQRNNVQWLDANGDGVLDKSDPAFAAIKLWVDVNQDGVQAGNEASGLSAMHISSINFRTGQVTYEDGRTDALTAQTLKADTEGVKFTQINEVNPDGTLHTLDAGTVLEHEGYQGKVQITDEGGTRWASEREQTYEQQAKRTGDWEGTAEQDAHRHGGGNAEGAPTETTATGATDFGPVKTSTTTTQSTVSEGSARVVSDVLTQAPQAQTNTQTTVTAGDSRIKSNAATINGATTTTTTTATSTPRPADTRIVFIPTSQTSVQSEIQAVTDSMIENSQSMLFGAGANAGLGVLAAVGMGAVQSAQATEQHPTLVGDGPSSSVSSAPNPVSSNNTFNTTPSVGSTDTSTSTVTFKQVDLGVFNVPQVLQTSTLSTTPQNTVTASTVPTPAEPPSTTFVYATVIVSAPAQVTPTKAPVTVTSTLEVTPNEPTNPVAAAANPLSLGYPEIQGETLPGTEDVVLRLTQSVLLANDSSPNASADPTQPALTITAVSQPLHGQVSLVNGEVLFAPDTNFHGTASFTYTVTDQYGLSTNGSATLLIAAVNDTPVTQGELVASDEDIGLIFTQAQLLANDSDVDVATDGQVLSISRVGDAQHGTVSLDAQGQVRFVPDLNYHGPAQFTYWVSDGWAADGAGAEVPATVNLTIAAVNDVPVVQGEAVATNEDTPLLIPAATLLANDSDVDTATDGQLLSLSAVSVIAGQTRGTVSLVTQPDGTQQVQFTPDLNYHGVATFNYTVSDGNGGFTTAIATVNIAAVNDAPVTKGESVSSDEDIGLIFTQAQLLANDSDVDVATDGQVLSISRVGQAEHGTVWLDVQGNLRFVPDTNYHGPAKFTYWVSDGAAADGAGAETPATMSLTIAAVNDIPVVQGESTNTTEDTTLSIDAATLLANDSDVDTATDEQVLSISAVSNAAHCTVNLVTQTDGTQHISFVPDANFHGAATFDYTVSDGNGGTAIATAVVNLSAVNDAPVTTGESATGDEDNTLVFTSHDLLANDTDVDVATDSQVLSISRVGSATHGTVSLDAQGQVHFTPDANYHGPAQFTYWVSDGLAANGAGAEVPATVTLTILAVNDLPVVTGETLNNRQEDVSLLFNPATLLANDTDVDTATDGQVLAITNISNAQHGTVAWATQPDGSQYIAFTPEANYFGVASYQYTVSDGNGGTATTTVVVNLTEVNDTPVAANDTVSNTAEDTALHISFASLLGNDTDADSHNAQWGGVDDVLTVTVVGNAVHGTVALVNDEVVFTPDANYHGPASFAYQVSDSSGAVSQALATFSVTAVNDVPVAVGETITENEDTTLVISQAALLQNDSDVDTATDGQVLSITAVSNAQHGTVTLNANGTISFVPVANFYGNASFDYTVDDGNGGTATTTATIALANVNDAPVATGESINSNEDEVLTIIASALLQNDSDIDNAHEDLTISRVQSGTGGTVSLNASGNVVFTPTLNYNGTATFTYWVKDPGGLESNAVTTTVVLAAVNDAPTVQGEIVTGASEDAVFNISSSTLLANDHDVDDPDSALTLSWVGNATGGTVSLNANGNVVFTPTLNFNGNATFQYKVRDAAGLESALVQAVIPVTAVNDVPVAVDDQFTTYVNTTMTIAFNQLTSNDTDADRDALTVSAVRDHANGHASIVNGQVQFVANAGFTGAASFDYLTDDGHGGQAWATAFVDVKQPPNQYATVNWTSSSGWGYDYVNQWVQTGFSISDDGDANAVQMTLVSASFQYPGGDWFDASGSYSLSRSGTGGSFRFEGYFDLLQTTWRVVDDRGLENIWYWNIPSWSAAKTYSVNSYNEHYGYYYPPLVMDLNGDGVHFTSIQNSNVSIDVTHDGINDKMAWAGNDDGVLVWDKDRNHQITDASEFGFQTLKAGAQTDLEGLQALDTNDNGLLDAGDAKFGEFAVWQDANGNGVTDAGEFKTLTELGIANINLHSDGQVRDAGTLLANSGSGETDATVMGNAAFTRIDGSTGVVADTMLAYEAGHAAPTITNTAVVDTSVHTLVSAPQPVEVSANATPQVVDTSAADAQTAEIIRQALLFNQVCNTAVAIDSAPLGFVPIQPDVQLHDILVTPQDGSHQFMQSA